MAMLICIPTNSLYTVPFLHITTTLVTSCLYCFCRVINTCDAIYVQVLGERESQCLC